MSILDNLTADGRARRVEQTDPPRSPRETLPTMYDLPSEDPEEPGLPDEFHDLQPQLLSRTLRLSRYSRENCFTASDLNLYYYVTHPLWQKRPDWFLVVGVPRLYEGTESRRSYVVWQEGKFPAVIVEFLSPGTEAEDLGRFQVAPLIWLDDLEVGLGIWQGDFEGVPDSWLRWCDGEGNWLLTDTEQEQFEKEQERAAREQEQLEKEQERAAKEQAQAQLLQTARNLLAMGMELEQVIAIAGLSDEQVRALNATDSKNS